MASWAAVLYSKGFKIFGDRPPIVIFSSRGDWLWSLFKAFSTKTVLFPQKNESFPQETRPNLKEI
ncbi:hypothetical protein AWQ23_08640 [Picosynechococcus sp. PCC 73109]|nr:hypothetical protein AWQ23_08640 [Picosynechococcus sp. PCC 73109]